MVTLNFFLKIIQNVYENLSQQQTNSNFGSKDFQYEQNFHIWVILILSSMVLKVSRGKFPLKEATKERPLYLRMLVNNKMMDDQIHHIHHWP